MNTNLCKNINKKWGYINNKIGKKDLIKLIKILPDFLNGRITTKND